MAFTRQDGKHNWIGIGVMLAVILVLGLRSKQTVNSVLTDKIPMADETVATSRIIGDDLLGVSARDSLVAAARIPDDVGDPFARTQAPRRVADRKLPPRVKRLTRPTLAGLIFDTVSPMVQITVGGKRSDWLKTGKGFKGWHVAEINANSVKITKGDREVVLH